MVQLFNYDKYRPENCKTPAQIFLIYEYLYYQWEWSKFNNNDTNVVPKALRTKEEGRPGTGKSFVTNTLRNMTRMIHKTNNADIASAPTGAAASIINGATHCRSAFIPTGKAFQKSPTNVNINDPNKIIALCNLMSALRTKIMDEDSMSGRNMWAWQKHRAEEFRQPKQLRNDDNKIFFQQQSTIP